MLARSQLLGLRAVKKRQISSYHPESQTEPADPTTRCNYRSSPAVPQSEKYSGRCTRENSEFDQ